MVARNIHYSTLLDVAHQLHTKQISPVELTEYMLKRIGTKDKKFRSYAIVTEQLARKQAEKAEKEIQRGHIKSLLHGVPIAV